MKIHFAIFLLLFSANAATQSKTVEMEQLQIARNLLPAIIVTNRPSKPETLTDKMADLRVPGVSVAVVKNCELIWAKG